METKAWVKTDRIIFTFFFSLPIMNVAQSWRHKFVRTKSRQRKETRILENKTPGKLFLCATPIGNLEDITFRVLETLRSVDLIAAEDTRHSIKLLNHFEIKTPMTSYHEFNKIDKGKYLVDQLLQGINIALVTDAGTPAISDPGEELVRMCLDAGIEVTSLPGPAACVTALTMSGLSARRFCFEGFLPTDKKERNQVLERLKNETRTTVMYEAPHRLVRTMEILEEVLGDRRIVFCKELTKKHERRMEMTCREALACFEKEEPRGEFVLVIEGQDPEVLLEEERSSWEQMSIEEHMEVYTDQGMNRKEAMKAVAADRGVSKRDIYQALLDHEQED